MERTCYNRIGARLVSFGFPEGRPKRPNYLRKACMFFGEKTTLEGRTGLVLTALGKEASAQVSALAVSSSGVGNMHAPDLLSFATVRVSTGQPHAVCHLPLCASTV